MSDKKRTRPKSREERWRNDEMAKSEVWEKKEM
jgi:hypothetical protein